MSVAELDRARARRRERFQALAEQAPHHPALRWHANGDPSLAHRRLRDVETTACGLPAVLMVLASSDVALCPECYRR